MRKEANATKLEHQLVLFIIIFVWRRDRLQQIFTINSYHFFRVYFPLFSEKNLFPGVFCGIYKRENFLVALV